MWSSKAIESTCWMNSSLASSSSALTLLKLWAVWIEVSAVFLTASECSKHFCLFAIDNKTTLSISKGLKTLSRLLGNWRVYSSTCVQKKWRRKVFLPIKRFSTISPVVVLYPHKYVRSPQTFHRYLLANQKQTLGHHLVFMSSDILLGASLTWTFIRSPSTTLLSPPVIYRSYVFCLVWNF